MTSDQAARLIDDAHKNYKAALGTEHEQVAYADLQRAVQRVRIAGRRRS